MGKYATLADFTNKDYEMTAIGPGNQKLLFLMRVPSTARRIEIEFDLCPRIVPPPHPKEPYYKRVDGSIHAIHDYEDPGYIKAENDRKNKLTAWLICESLIDPAIEGDTIEDKIALYYEFSPWVKAALAQGYNQLTILGQDKVKVRPFRGDGVEDQPTAD